MYVGYEGARGTVAFGINDLRVVVGCQDAKRPFPRISSCPVSETSLAHENACVAIAYAG